MSSKIDGELEVNVAMIDVIRLHRSCTGDLILHFRKVDSNTKRPTGGVCVSSPLVSINKVNDAHGAMHNGDEACVAIETETGSVYLAVMSKVMVNQINQVVRLIKQEKVA